MEYVKDNWQPKFNDKKIKQEFDPEEYYEN